MSNLTIEFKRELDNLIKRNAQKGMKEVDFSMIFTNWIMDRVSRKYGKCDFFVNKIQIQRDEKGNHIIKIINNKE